MKRFVKFSVIVFNICIILAVGIASALLLASSHGYYKDQFEKNGIYSTIKDGKEVRKIIYYVDGNPDIYAFLSDEHYDIIIDHVIDYLFGDKTSFELTLDGVYIFGVGDTSDVSIFGDDAVSHMEDVRLLVRSAIIIGIASALISASLLAFFIIKRRECSKFLLRYTGYFYMGAAIFVAGFCIFTLFTSLWAETPYLYQLWGNLHYLLFPFQPEKYENSYLADPLPQILSLELFITALLWVLLSIAVAVALWITVAHLIKRKSAL